MVVRAHAALLRDLSQSESVSHFGVADAPFGRARAFAMSLSRGKAETISAFPGWPSEPMPCRPQQPPHDSSKIGLRASLRELIFKCGCHDLSYTVGTGSRTG
jgi:hypothetical protein